MLLLILMRRSNTKMMFVWAGTEKITPSNSCDVPPSMPEQFPSLSNIHVRSLDRCMSTWSYLIFVTGTTGGARGKKKLSCGEICPYNRLSGGEILHMTDCHVEKNLHMRNVNKIWNVEKNLAKNCARGEKMTNMRYVLLRNFLRFLLQTVGHP